MKPADLLNKAIRDDYAVWFESEHCKIWPKDKSKGLINPKQNYLQIKFQKTIAKFEELDLPIRLICLKPRQRGSSVGLSSKAYHRIRSKPTTFCAIGGQLDQTNSIWDMIQNYQANDTFKWGNTGTVTSTTASWTNGSEMIAETANDKMAGISKTITALHVTELAKWSEHGVSDASTVLANILKCVPGIPGTMVVIESTAEGSSGEYFERWQRAVDCDDFIAGRRTVQAGEYVRVFAGWFQFEDSARRLTEVQKREIERTLDAEPEFAGNGRAERELIEKYGVVGADGITRLGTAVVNYDVWEQLAWRRVSIKEECSRDHNIFDRDYPSCPEVAFQKSGNLRFNQAGLAAIRKRMGLRVAMPGILEEAQGGRPAFRPTDMNEAKVILYERPIPSMRYLLTIDPMTGASQATGQDPDYHGAHILRAGYFDNKGEWNRPSPVARVVQCRWDIDVLTDAAHSLARFYGDTSGAKIVVEMNMDRGIVELLKLKGADLYTREVFNKSEFKTTKSYGYVTDPRTRERMIERLAAAIREHDTRGDGIDIWDETTMKQLENFIVKQSGRSEAASGHHDDDVTSIAMGLLLIDHATSFFPSRGGFGLPPDLAALGFGQQSSTPGAYS